MKPKKNLMKISIQSYRQTNNEIFPLPSPGLTFIFSRQHWEKYQSCDTRRRDFVDTKYTLWCLLKIKLKTICENFSIEITKKKSSESSRKGVLTFLSIFTSLWLRQSIRDLIKFKLFFCDIDTWWLYQRDLLWILFYSPFKPQKNVIKVLFLLVVSTFYFFIAKILRAETLIASETREFPLSMINKRKFEFNFISNIQFTSKDLLRWKQVRTRSKNGRREIF